MPGQILQMDSRQLIPRWHTSRKSMRLQFPNLSGKPSQYRDKISDEFLENNRYSWKAQKSIQTASELYTALLVRDMLSDVDAKGTLNFLLSVNSPLPSGISSIINPQLKHVDKSESYATKTTQIIAIITRLKSIIKKFPNDYMSWGDLAFYYASLGEDEKAYKALSTSWHLCDGHPLIARSYARYLIHQEQPDKALWLLNKSGLAKTNPLITSALLAISNSFDINVPVTLNGKKILESYSGEPAFSSDLAACLGTLEYQNGNVKKAKMYFKQALDFPSENTLSQYKWLHHKTGFNIANSGSVIKNTIEGNVHELYVTGKFLECRTRLIELFEFQPFTDSSIADAGYMSLVGLNDPNFVFDLSNDRLNNKTHMGFGELNNLIVAKLMMHNFDDIELLMRILAKKVKPNSDSKGVYIATSALLMIQSDFIEQGKDLYDEAILFFKKRKNNYSVALAEHYYSMAIRGIDDEIYLKLRKNVDAYAKKSKKSELLTVS